MFSKRVLIVEDDPLIAMDVESALLAADYEICGSVSSEADALSVAFSTKPEFAVVDVNLSPGDGCNVARELISRHATTVLMATGECDDPSLLFSRTGATACLGKPYDANRVAGALATAHALHKGYDPGNVPGYIIVLGAIKG